MEQTSEQAKSVNKTGIYNLNYLKKTRENKSFSVNVMVDSIGTGSSATGNYGFISQLIDSMNVLQGKINYSYGDFYYDATVGSWNKEETGLSKHLLSSKDSSSALSINPIAAQTPQFPYKVQIVYSKRTDGGTFEVRTSNGSLLGTLNSFGEKEDGLKSPIYDIPSGQYVKITPLTGNKAYVNGWERYLYINEPSYKVKAFGQGGRAAKDYTNEELVTNVKFDNPDLVIWELLANDFSGGDLTAYKEKTLLAMETARSIGADVLIAIPCGNSNSESVKYREVWVEFLKQVSKEYKTALIDYDEIFGGYTNAKYNGLIYDTIHPTDLGHLLMANDLVEVVLGVENVYLRKTRIDITDTRLPFYNTIQQVRSNHFLDTQFFKETPETYSVDSNGNTSYRKILKLIAPNSSLSQLPKYEERGQIATFNRRLYVNNTDWGVDKRTNVANWQKIISNPEMEELNGIPTDVSDIYLNRLFRLSIAGKDDQIVTYIMTYTGSRKWVKLTTTDDISWA